jgi:hypothetical protein
MTQTKSMRALSYLLLFSSFLPYVWKIPYMANAWRHSPMDRYDWVFLLIAGLALLACFRLLLTRHSHNRGVYMLALLPSLLFIVTGEALEIHALSILGAVAFAWSMLWFTRGWRAAYTAFPVYAILALSSTSTSYWLGYFSGNLQWNGLAIKAIMALLLLLWWLANIFYERQMPRESFCFYLIFAALLLGAWQVRTHYRSAAPFIPDFASIKNDEFFGQPLPITPADERFFGPSDIGKFTFASDINVITILTVSSVDRVHQIHPASHCLRVSGWGIAKESIANIIIANKKLAVSEILAHREGQRIIMWVWYSSTEHSTGSFLAFRRLWRQGTPWFSAQISTPYREGEEENARATLNHFLSIAKLSSEAEQLRLAGPTP